MERVSSNSSLFLKIFIPTFWLVFFGLFTLMTVITENENPVFNTIEYKISIIILYLIGALVMYWSFIKLKRVEMGPKAFSVSNYFKTYQYSYGSIDFFRENNYFIFRTDILNFYSVIGHILDLPSTTFIDFV